MLKNIISVDVVEPGSYWRSKPTGRTAVVDHVEVRAEGAHRVEYHFIDGDIESDSLPFTMDTEWFFENFTPQLTDWEIVKNIQTLLDPQTGMLTAAEMLESIADLLKERAA
jgi:hypothetical protein